MLARRQLPIAIFTTIVALSAHSWILWSKSLPASLDLISFGAVCIFLSWTIASFKHSNAPRTTATPVQVRTTVVMSASAKQRMQLAPTAAPVANAFTIDLEDYFHTEVASRAIPAHTWDSMPTRIRSSVPKLLDLLDAHDTKATIFVLGWVARKYPALVREAARRGHEIACHSHRHRAVFRLDRESFSEDTRIAKQAIEDATGAVVQGYRAPSFSITLGTEWAFDVLAELGFSYDSSVNPVRHKFYGNPNAPRHPYYVSRGRLLEIPIATWRIAGHNLPIGGGAYLRLLPGKFVEMGLRQLNQKEFRAGTLYMHPWEIDPLQPPLDLDRLSHIRQAWGTATMERKLSRLMSAFRFAPINQVYADALMPAQATFTYAAATSASYAEVV
jgi:polysaccharide deacetylase family protein (PEP-CTERM system associated)